MVTCNCIITLSVVHNTMPKPFHPSRDKDIRCRLFPFLWVSSNRGSRPT